MRPRTFRGRWPVIDREVDRLGVGNLRVIDAISAVCVANGIEPPHPKGDPSTEGALIQAILIAKGRH